MSSETSPTATKRPTHAVFLLHGLWGYQTNMFSLRDALRRRAAQQDAAVNVYCCHSYEGTLTYDGVDVCADRALSEILNRIRELEKTGSKIVKFSVLGYSLGGLIARMVVYNLRSQGFFDHVEPVNFATFASPAIGIPKPPGALSDMIQAFSAFFLSRTGLHLYLRDRRNETGRPLAYDLATEPYVSAVAMFRRVDIYANSVGDRVVPYLTGGIAESDPFLPALTSARHKQANTGTSDDGHPMLLLDDLQLTFDREHPAIIINVTRNSATSPSTPSNSPSPITTPARLSLWSSIRPWFIPATYPFLPRPLACLLIVMLPLVLPPALLIVGAFFVQRTASALRVRRHLQERERRNNVGNGSKATAGEKPPNGVHTMDVEAQNLSSADPLDPPPVDQASSSLPPPSPNPQSHAQHHTLDLSGLYSSTSPPPSSILPPMQREMISLLSSSLFSLPHVRRHLTFLPNVFTSHTAIIVQDPNDREDSMGESVVRCWADGFEF